MTLTNFIPHHINADADDFKGNNGIGRYVILPGSDGRAKDISTYFDNVSTKEHSRGHNLYLGTLACAGKPIDVATISTGMGCPSMEIILHELFQLGAKRFLRVGTAGSLQPDLVKLGDIVNAQASVRDENTTTDYVPLEVPATASLEFSTAVSQAAMNLALADQLHTGVIHCKGSLYAREFGAGPNSERNREYIDLLTRCGVLASEMETSALFVQSQLYNYELMRKGTGPQFKVIAGAILSIIAVPPQHFQASPTIDMVIEQTIQLALETIKVLAAREITR